LFCLLSLSSNVSSQGTGMTYFSSSIEEVCWDSNVTPGSHMLDEQRAKSFANMACEQGNSGLGVPVSSREWIGPFRGQWTNGC
jgi:hypothetical protein